MAETAGSGKTTVVPSRAAFAVYGRCLRPLSRLVTTARRHDDTTPVSRGGFRTQGSQGNKEPRSVPDDLMRLQRAHRASRGADRTPAANTSTGLSWACLFFWLALDP